MFYDYEGHQVHMERLDELDFAKATEFSSGNINSSEIIIESTKHIFSGRIMVNGKYGVSCPAEYTVTVYAFDVDGNFVASTTYTDTVTYPENSGYLRFVISGSDESDITPASVDFSKIKITGNFFSAKDYAKDKSFVLDAENCLCDDVFAYIDEAVKTHGMYATKTFLCTETSGISTYYYTLGSGSKKLCIVSGQHGPGSDGDPRDSVITVAKMVRDLIDGEFVHGSFLQKLHDEYTILIIPILNAYGFNNRSRTDANNTDTNRDWVDGNTIEVGAAKTVISTFEPSIAFDVHCNGTKPIVNSDIEIQFGLGDTHNSSYLTAIRKYFKECYNTDVASRTSNTTTTLQYYIQTTLSIMGGLLELRWWLKDSAWLHNAQVESCNYAMLINIIKYCASVNDQETFVYEHTPNQNQY